MNGREDRIERVAAGPREEMWKQGREREMEMCIFQDLPEGGWGGMGRLQAWALTPGSTEHRC